MDILILNTYPSRSSLFRDNGTGNTLVSSHLHKRRGGGCRSCVIGPRINSRVSHMFLTFCSRAPAFYRLKTHGIPFAAQCGATFLPFYSAKLENLSENRSEVAPPQRETRILIENGNEVARPPCQTFHSRIFIQKGNAVV